MWSRIRTITKSEKVVARYVGIGITTGIIGSTITLVDNNRRGLPLYTQIAERDPTGVMTTPIAYGCVSLTKAGAVGIVTGVMWPVTMVYVAGVHVKLD